MGERVAPYFLHNIDGRRCGMIVAKTKREVARAFRVAEAEIERLPWAHPNENMQDGINLAKTLPGRLYVQPILGFGPLSWVADKRIPDG